MSRWDCHIAPDKAAIAANVAKEPEGERIRAELIDFLNRNKIVSIFLDTDEHCIDIGIVKLPPEIKPVLGLWGSIYVRNEPQAFAPPARRMRLPDSRYPGLNETHLEVLACARAGCIPSSCNVCGCAGKCIHDDCSGCGGKNN